MKIYALKMNKNLSQKGIDKSIDICYNNITPREKERGKKNVE
jgi:hypothetical protein